MRAQVTAGLLAGAISACAGANGPSYRSFNDVPYGYSKERTVWSSTASLQVRVAELDGPARPLPLVLLHPWGLNMTVWADVAPRLAEQRRVLLVDLPGHGKSDKVHARLPIERLAAAVADAMTAAGVDRAYVAGNSLGGATALALAARAPQRVAGLVLIGAPGGAPIPTPLRRLVEGVAKPAELASLSGTAWWAGMRIAERSDGPLARRLIADALALRDAVEFPAWCRSSVVVLRSVLAFAPPLERIEVPTLVVYGDADWVISTQATQALARRLPRATLQVIEGCGHLPEVECPQALIAAMTRYWQQAPTAGR